MKTNGLIIAKSIILKITSMSDIWSQIICLFCLICCVDSINRFAFVWAYVTYHFQVIRSRWQYIDFSLINSITTCIGYIRQPHSLGTFDNNLYWVTLDNNLYLSEILDNHLHCINSITTYMVVYLVHLTTTLEINL